MVGDIFIPYSRGKPVFTVTPTDKERYDALFVKLGPFSGLLDGNKIKEVLLQSKLQPKMLAQIWELSDLGADGKMDRVEFAIAMCLIENVLGGQSVPTTLPMSLKSLSSVPPPGPPAATINSAFGGPPSFPSGGFPPSGPAQTLPRPPQGFPGTSEPKSATLPKPPTVQIPAIPARSMQPPSGPAPFAPQSGFPPVSGFPSTLPPQQSVPPRRDSLPVGPGSDWLVPVQSRNKYRQQFAMIDQGRTGLMPAAPARNALLQTGVDTNRLARIWDLSDIDKTGTLNTEEFILAMHLTDMVKAGEPLPNQLPPLLIPPSKRPLNATPQASGASGGGAGPSSGEPPAQKNPPPATFEDKRKQNFDMGEAALEKKRLAMLEAQKREKEERLEKERQEEERRARERAEAERRRLENMAEQQRRAEEARRELEARQQAEADRKMAATLEQRKAATTSEISSLRSTNHQLQSDLELLKSKKNSLQEQVSEKQNSLKSVQSQVSAKTSQYEARVRHREKLQHQLQEFNRTLKLYAEKRNEIERQVRDQETRNPIAAMHKQLTESLNGQRERVKQLQQQINTAEKETADKFHSIDVLNQQIQECKNLLASKSKSGSSVKPVSQSKPVANDPFGSAFPSQGTSAFGGAAAKSNDPFAGGSDPFGAPSTGCNDLFAGNAFNAAPSTTTGSKPFDPFGASSIDPFGAGPNVYDAPADAFGAAAAAAPEPKPTDPFAPPPAISGDAFASVPNDKFSSFDFDTTKTDPFGSTSVSSPSKSLSAASPSQPMSPGLEYNYRALHDYTATDDADLSFKAGDVIRVSSKQNLDEPWLAGFLHGKGGWFPANYTQRISEATASPPPTPKISTTQPAAPAAQDEDTVYSEFPAEYGTEYSDLTCVCVVEAVYPFEAAQEGDLGFNQGDTICVTSDQGDWWIGYLKSDSSRTSGTFPSNFVSVINSTGATSASSAMSSAAAAAPPTSLSLGLPPGAAGGDPKKHPEMATVIADFVSESAEQLSLVAGQVVVVRKKLPSGWWEGEIQGEKKRGWFPGDYVRLISSGLTPIPSAKSSPDDEDGPGGEKVKALFPFTAERDNELSFLAGDVITVLAKDNPDWWRGKLSSGGPAGLFPASFVEPA